MADRLLRSAVADTQDLRATDIRHPVLR